MILIDAYPKGTYTFQNVGIDDYSGGYQIGEYLYSCGYKKALFVAETEQRQRLLSVDGIQTGDGKIKGDSAVVPDI